MPKLFEQARFKLAGFDTNTTVDIHSPLVEQAQLVYNAAHHIAQRDGWANAFYHGVAGRRGPLNQKNLITQLLTDSHTAVNDAEDLMIKSVAADISATLRNSNAMKCLFKGDFNATPAKPPVWWVADSATVTVGTSVRSTRAPFAENNYLNDKEKRVTVTEAGEDRPTSEVTVTKVRKPLGELDPVHMTPDERGEYSERLNQLIGEEVATNTQPVSARDLQQILASQHTVFVSVSSLRDHLNRLVDLGQLVSRDELPTERHVRATNGHGVRARGPVLYAAAPGPVPERTALPDGVKPPTFVRNKDAGAYQKQVLQFLAERNGMPPVSSSVFGVLYSLSDSWLRLNVLVPMLNHSWVTEHGRGYFTITANGWAALHASDQPQPETKTKTDEPVTVTTASDADSVAAEITRMISRRLAEGSAGFRERIEELEAEVARKDKVIRQLKETIAALE